MENNLSYVIELMDKEDTLLYPVIVKGEEQLAQFLLHFNKDKYIVNDIGVLGLLDTDTTEYIKKDNNLELGKGANDVNE